MKLNINDGQLLPEAIPLKNGSVLNYYLQDYIRIDIENNLSISSEVHLIDFLISLTELLNIDSREEAFKVNKIMDLSGELFQANYENGAFSIALYDMNLDIIQSITINREGWEAVQIALRDFLKNSLRAYGIELERLSDLKLVTLI